MRQLARCDSASTPAEATRLRRLTLVALAGVVESRPGPCIIKSTTVAKCVYIPEGPGPDLCGVPIMDTKQAQLSAGPIEYVDSGGSGPVVVLCHGLLMDSSVWDEVVGLLARSARVIAPTFPVGGHRQAMRQDADLSLNGQAAILGEFLTTVGLDRVTLVVSDLGYPILLAANQHPSIAQLVLLPCELYDNIPPGMPGRAVSLAARIPGGILLAVHSLLAPGASRLPMTLGRLARRVPKRMLRSWTDGPRRSAAIRRDLSKYATASDLHDLLDATGRLRDFTKPTLLLWSKADRLMPYQHAVRLAAAMPVAQLVTFDSGNALLQLDNPSEVAKQLILFLAGSELR